MVKTSNLFNKALVVGVIFLFLGVGIQQAIATVQQEEEIGIVQDLPIISFEYEILGGNFLIGWDILIMVIAFDEMSGMDRLEIYFNDVLKDIVYGNGSACVFVCEFHYPPPPAKPNIILKAVAYDLAGNSAIRSFNLNILDLNRHSRNNFFNTYLQNVFSKWLIDRFLLLDVFLRIMNLLIFQN